MFGFEVGVFPYVSQTLGMSVIALKFLWYFPTDRFTMVYDDG